jgi:hypothetical protein
MAAEGAGFELNASAPYNNFAGRAGAGRVAA